MYRCQECVTSRLCLCSRRPASCIPTHSAKPTSASSTLIPSKATMLKSLFKIGLALYSIFPTTAEISGHTGYDFVVANVEPGFGTIAEPSCFFTPLQSPKLQPIHHPVARV
ncbi:hypothetical protein Ancab_032893 [Ancistrocladus abbreviatus]